MRRFLAVVAASVLVLGACSGDDDDSTDGASTTSTTIAERTTTTTGAPATSTVATTSSTEVGCDPGAAPPAAVTGGNAGEPGTLTDLTAVADGCVDQVVFTFAANVPGYSIDYQPGPFTEDGSGEPVEVAGNAFLVVRLEPAYSFDFEAGTETYTGPRELMPGGRYVQEIENTGDFEAVMTWIIGLSEPAAFEASVAGSTLTIVVGNRE